MIGNIINSEEYKQIVSEQIRELIEYLLSIDEEFALTANIKGVEFNPKLPLPIKKQLAPFSLFILANYSYQSILLEDEVIKFEAGFGKENFGSVVTIPFSAIFQIIVDESILYINPAATVEKHFTSIIEQKQRSFDAFKKNTPNKDLF